MSDSTPGLPHRPSLEQLRKQAKELLRSLCNGNLSAIGRLHLYKPDVLEPILADAQYVLAREHGFDSWPRLVHHIQVAKLPQLEEHQRLAEDLVAAYNSADAAAITRLNDLFHSALNVEQIRDFVRDKLFDIPDAERHINNLSLPDAQLVLARLYGFKDWDAFLQSSTKPPADLRSASFVS